MSHALFYWSIFTIIGSWLIRLTMLVVVIRRKRASAAMGWLVVIFFMPWLGLVLYLLIGENGLSRRRIARYRRLQDEFKSIHREYLNRHNLIRPNLSHPQDATAAIAEHLTGMPILTGNNAELLSQTDTVIRRLIADIEHATQTVHLMFYIFADDRTGNRIRDALARAVDRGVICRVLVDSVGSQPMIGTLGKRLKESGVQFIAVLPASIFRLYIARMDLRNHRKIAVIDGNIAYTGSQNIVDAGYGRKDLAWHDIMVRLTGPVVMELQAVFTGDWYSETEEVLDGPGIFVCPEITGSMSVQTLPSGPTDPTENYQRSVVAALYAAEHQVTITTPYFVPDDVTVQALQVAALRGVTVELIVPERLDQRIVGAASRAYFDELLESGVTIYLYTAGLLHSKSICIDDSLAFIGTSNFDIRSFALNFEINMVFFGSDFIQILKELHDEYRSHSVPVIHEKWESRPASRKLGQYVAKLLSPLL